MRLLRNSIIALVLVLTAGIASAFAQGPIQKTIHFSVNVPYTFKHVHYMLPAGTYVLRQISANNRSEFWLYRDDMMHSPIAIVSTVPIYHVYPYANDHTKMYYRTDEDTEDAHPIIEGWNIAGDDGWEIISIVPSREMRLETRSSR